VSHMSQTPKTMSQTQSQSQPKYENCLLVSRHRLLSSQETDLATICGKISKVDTLPNNIDELKKMVDFYDAIVGVIPLTFQVQLLQMKKAVLLFYMESLGTTGSKQEAEQLLAGREGVILPPSREGESYRVSVYRGIKKVKAIKVEDEFIIQH